MIDRQGAKILIECDSCDEIFEGDERAEFAAVWTGAKRDGWRSRKIGEDWIHKCPKCSDHR
jgi:hypothetical protein